VLLSGKVGHRPHRWRYTPTPVAPSDEVGSIRASVTKVPGRGWIHPAGHRIGFVSALYSLHSTRDTPATLGEVLSVIFEASTF